MKCEDCKYYDQEQEYCKYLSCDGLDCDDAPCGFQEPSDYIMRPEESGGLGYKEKIDWINEHGNMNIKY